MTTRKLTTMAMFTALSVTLVWLIHFPIFPAAPYLEYDPADIPILLGTFAFGPVSGLILTLMAALIQGLTVSSASGVYGIIMHFLATGTFVIVAGFIYKYKKTPLFAATGLICGALCMAAVMAGANLIVTPAFTGAPVSVIKALLLPVIVPFNLIKAGVNGAVVFSIYMVIAKFIKPENVQKALNGK